MAFAFARAGTAAVLITQYYEGTSSNKWIELTNLGAATVDLSTYTLSLFSNANAEGYKTGASASSTTALSGSLASGATVLYRNSASVLPAYAAGTAAGSVNFNGNDSMVLFNSGTIEDAIGFTNGGNEGQDKSFIRNSSAAGFDLVADSNVTSFPSVWTEVSLAAVENAATGTNERLGATTLVPVPEPSAMILAGLSISAILLLRRRR
jgi:predicted extracellular nuclease